MSYGIAREQGLLGAQEIARSLNGVAKAINRLAAAVERDRKADRQPIGLVIRTEQTNDD